MPNFRPIDHWSLSAWAHRTVTCAGAACWLLSLCCPTTPPLASRAWGIMRQQTSYRLQFGRLRLNWNCASPRQVNRPGLLAAISNADLMRRFRPTLAACRPILLADREAHARSSPAVPGTVAMLVVASKVFWCVTDSF